MQMCVSASALLDGLHARATGRGAGAERAGPGAPGARCLGRRRPPGRLVLDHAPQAFGLDPHGAAVVQPDEVAQPGHAAPRPHGAPRAHLDAAGRLRRVPDGHRQAGKLGECLLGLLLLRRRLGGLGARGARGARGGPAGAGPPSPSLQRRGHLAGPVGGGPSDPALQRLGRLVLQLLLQLTPLSNQVHTDRTGVLRIAAHVRVAGGVSGPNRRLAHVGDGGLHDRRPLSEHSLVLCHSRAGRYHRRLPGDRGAVARR
mmetsp:Transcript_21179/g.56147  ORF Transcript_21179/g.56147 Transcript_21179/m.56147 type:complete len:258 (-) Transcript_21179:136-909(-)